MCSSADHLPAIASKTSAQSSSPASKYISVYRIIIPSAQAAGKFSRGKARGHVSRLLKKLLWWERGSAGRAGIASFGQARSSIAHHRLLILKPRLTWVPASAGMTEVPIPALRWAVRAFFSSLPARSQSTLLHAVMRAYLVWRLTFAPIAWHTPIAQLG